MGYSTSWCTFTADVVLKYSLLSLYKDNNQLVWMIVLDLNIKINLSRPPDIISKSNSNLPHPVSYSFRIYMNAANTLYFCVLHLYTIDFKENISLVILSFSLKPSIWLSHNFFCPFSHSFARLSPQMAFIHCPEIISVF